MKVLLATKRLIQFETAVAAVLSKSTLRSPPITKNRPACVYNRSEISFRMLSTIHSLSLVPEHGRYALTYISHAYARYNIPLRTVKGVRTVL